MIAGSLIVHRFDALPHGVARPAGEIKTPRIDEEFDLLFADARLVGPLDKIIEALVGASPFPLFNDHGDDTLAHPFDPRHCKANARFGCGKLTRGFIDIGRKDSDMERLRLADELGEFGRIIPVASHERGHPFIRIIGLEKGGRIGEIRIGRSVRFVEAVGGKLFNFIENAAGRIGIDPFQRAAAEELFPLTSHLVSIFFAHGSAQDIALAERVAGERAGDLHHLLLIDHNAVRFGQDILHQRMVDLCRFTPVFAVDEGGDHVHWTWAIEGAHSDDLLKRIDVELFGEILHTARLELEHAERLSLIEQIKSRLIIERQIDPVDPLARILGHGIGAFLDRSECF